MEGKDRKKPVWDRSRKIEWGRDRRKRKNGVEIGGKRLNGVELVGG